MRKARGHDLLSSSLQAESPAHFWAHASFRFCTYSGRRIEGKGGELQKKGGVAYLQEETSDGLRRQVAVGIVV